jgi:hypothetical protein
LGDKPLIDTADPKNSTLYENFLRGRRIAGILFPKLL